MTFKKLVWKMAKVQYKKYIFYFLCNSFAVMFFFMFSTVYFNERIVQANTLDGIQDALTIPAVALIVFTVFFISYAHNVFMKRRRSEFGLFMTLGMSHRDIRKLLLLENGVIAFFSIISGILAGAIFSRLFFLLLMNRVGLQEAPFYLNSKMFMYPIIVFAIVFFIAVGKSLFVTLKGNVIQSLKSDKVAEIIKMKSPLFGGLGLVIVVGSLLLLYYTYSNPTMLGSIGGYLLLATGKLLIGVYISLYQFTSFFIEIAKKNKPFYYRRLMYLTNIDYKFKQLTSILMLVTVMIMITILYTTLLLTFYKSSEKKAIELNPYDIAFIQTETKNNLPLEEIYSIIDRKEHPVQKHHVIPVFYHYQKHSYWDTYSVYVFMSVDHFNKLTDNQKKLQENEYLYYINDEHEHAAGNPDYDYAQDITFPIGNEKVTYTLKEKIAERNINIVGDLYEFIIVSNSEFERLKNNLDGFEANLHLINVANWKNSTNAVKELVSRLKSYNKSTPPIVDVRTENLSEELFRIASKVEDYNSNKSSNGILFFVTTFLSVVFFFGTFILLYLNLFSDIDKEKEKYNKLYKIGITVKEVGKIISREIMTIFFVPTILGTVLAFLYLVVLATDVGGIMKNLDVLVHFFVVAGIYLCIQVGYYLYARKKIFFHLTEFSGQK